MKLTKKKLKNNLLTTMKSFLQRNLFSILSCISIPIYFIIHNYLDFSELVDFSKLTSSLILWMLTPFILAVLYFAITRNFSKASLLTSIVLILFFFGATILKDLRSLPLLRSVLRYSISLPLIILSLSYLHYYIFRTKSSFVKLHTYISITFLVLLLFDITTAFIDKFQLNNKKEIITSRQKITLSKKTNQNTIKPDIFLLIFDEYPSSGSLYDVFGFKNSSIDSSLTSYGFKVSPYARSAYFNTTASIFSILNLTELSPFEKREFSFKEQLVITNHLSNASLIPFLNNEGYYFINSSMFNFANTPSSVRDIIYWNPPEDMVRNQTFFRKVKSDIGWNFVRFYKKSFMKEFNENILSEVKYSNKIKQLLDSTLQLTHEKPKFFYGHFFLPHDPYKFDEFGNVIHWDYDSYIKKYNTENSYINQIKYANNLMIELATKILNKNKRPAVIVIQGDHGNRDFVEKRFSSENKTKILSAIYFPDQQYNHISDSLYAPNTFRIILNKYFNQDLPLLIRKPEKIQPTHTPSTPNQ